MESDGANKIPRSEAAEGSEPTIEIKIKTLDSQTYTLRVDKQMPVPALKDQIASVTGVLSEQQRLICRGKVLKDDQLLSAYHVEDGHTLHLVVRQPIPASAEGLNYPATDPASSTSRAHGGHPSVVIETFSLPDQGDGVPTEISRIVSAVLGSFGFSNIGSAGEGVDVARERGFLRTSASSATVDAMQLQPEQAAIRGQSDGLQSAFGLPTAVSLGSVHPPVFPDSLATLSQYLTNMRCEFDAIGRGGENINQADAAHRFDQRDSNPISQSASAQERLPTPAALAEVIRSSRQLLIDQAAESLLQLAIQLEDQANVTDPALRLNTQSSAWRTGVQLHNLGAFLLELGRTTMTVRLGQGPSEAVVNAGPAVFVNPSGPNPLMVQPLPFQPATSFGAIPTGSVQPGSGMVNGIGTGFLPRRIDIQIRRGSSTSTPNVNREERGDTQQVSGQRNSLSGSGGENTGNQTTSRIAEGSSLTGEPGVQVVPIRTMVAEVPGSFGRLPSDSSGNIGLSYPVLGRFQHVSSGHVNAGRGSQPSAENHRASVNVEEQSTSETDLMHQDSEHRTREESNSRQPEPSGTRSMNINILSAGGTQNNQESERRIPNSVLQFLRNLFPGGDIHVEEASLRGPATDSAADNAGTSTTSVESERIVTDEGIFLSNLLREIMPFISRHRCAEPNATPSGEAHASEHQMAHDSPVHAESSDVGTSHRHSDSELFRSNSKRQKTEKAFLKQPKVFLYSKKTGKGKRPGKGGNRFWKSIGLGFKTPSEAIEGTYIDKKCPFAGTVYQGCILDGTCHSAKMMRTIIVRRNYLHYIKKYQRYEKRHSNIPAHISPCFRVMEGDHVIIGQCRPLSKTVRFNVLKVILAGSSGGGKKAFNGV